MADGVIHYLSHIKLLTALNEILAYGAATVFIVVFTRVTIREIALRAEVERLKEELGQLELHVERVDTWTKYIGKWTAHISSSDVRLPLRSLRPLVSLFDNFSSFRSRRKEEKR